MVLALKSIVRLLKNAKNSVDGIDESRTMTKPWLKALTFRSLG